MNRADVVVVGAGVMGAATAAALAAAGRHVVLVDRFRIGHGRGSSHGSSRIFRLSYPEDRWVRLAQRALAGWRTLERETSQSLLALHGGIDLGSAVPAHTSALAAAGASFEQMDPSAVTARFPALRPPDQLPALVQPDAGITYAERAWTALVSRAVAAGCELREEVEVRRLRRVAGGVEVDCGEPVRADAAVVTAGAWARPLLASVGIDLDVVATRQTVAYFALPIGPAPSVVEWSDPPMYALDAPGMADGYVLKAGEHHAGAVADPDTPGAPDAAAVARIARWVASRFPQADPRPLDAHTCLYTSTPDHDFVLRRHGPVVVGSACSGHGFKFAPVVGSRLATLATQVERHV